MFACKHEKTASPLHACNVTLSAQSVELHCCMLVIEVLVTGLMSCCDTTVLICFRYLNLLQDKEKFAFVRRQSDDSIISLPPLTNSDVTKISRSTTDVFVEVNCAVLIVASDLWRYSGSSYCLIDHYFKYE